MLLHLKLFSKVLLQGPAAGELAVSAVIVEMMYLMCILTLKSSFTCTCYWKNKNLCFKVLFLLQGLGGSAVGRVIAEMMYGQGWPATECILV